ncbi:MAG TPA: hypothetical protein VJL81_01290 [Solirubrobacterales bacterium]|nr:hypothetical protein [Solirubrobacterales bacterium]
MRSKMTRVILAGVLALVAMGSVFSASAGAAPQWKFNGTALTGTEDIVGAAISSSLTIPGMTTTCEHFLYNMKIENAAGTGKGSITELPLFECHTASGKCTVEAIGAKKLPWPTHLTTISSNQYLIVEGVEVGILYGGAECALSEVEILVKGTAGGLISNETETATFNSSTFTTTGTKLKVGATAIEWNGVFPTEGFEWHREQALSVG